MRVGTLGWQLQLLKQTVCPNWQRFCCLANTYSSQYLSAKRNMLSFFYFHTLKSLHCCLWSRNSPKVSFIIICVVLNTVQQMYEKRDILILLTSIPDLVPSLLQSLTMRTDLFVTRLNHCDRCSWADSRDNTWKKMGSSSLKAKEVSIYHARNLRKSMLNQQTPIAEDGSLVVGKGNVLVNFR